MIPQGNQLDLGAARRSIDSNYSATFSLFMHPNE